jgi:hypothetical protein
MLIFPFSQPHCPSSKILPVFLNLLPNPLFSCSIRRSPNGKFLTILFPIFQTQCPKWHAQRVLFFDHSRRLCVSESRVLASIRWT